MSNAANYIDLQGKKFSRLTAIKTLGKTSDRQFLWLCTCDCGETAIVIGRHLRSGHTKSCGCFKNEVSGARLRSHGKSHLPEHKIWIVIQRRCYEENFSGYANYGGRGIKVSNSWKQSFVTFLEDMGPRPSSKHSIDRIDNNKDYCKENCKWATCIEQARNKRNVRVLTYQGITKSIPEWSEYLNISTHALNYRCRKNWDIEKIFTTPVRS